MSRTHVLLSVSVALLLSPFSGTLAQEADRPPEPAGPAASGSASDAFKSLLGGFWGLIPGSSGADAPEGKPSSTKPAQNSPARPLPLASPSSQPLPAAGAQLPQKGGGAAKAVLLEPSHAALNELRADRKCSKTEEQHDVFQKVLAFGGTNAQLRLNQLIATDFKHSDLTPQDKLMLKYLAYTTVWVPIEVEDKVGAAYAKLFRESAGEGDAGRAERNALAKLNTRAAELAEKMPGFPGKVTVVLERSSAAGAVAKPGNIVAVNAKFLSAMDQNPDTRDVVLAHELSHLYKRHTIKELQFQLITSAGGFKLGQKLLTALKPTDSPIAIINSWIGSIQAASELVDAVKASQAKYPSEQELEADICGLKFLEIAGVKGIRAWQIFHQLLQASAADGSAGYAGVHPSPKERNDNVKLALSKGTLEMPKVPVDRPSANPQSARGGSATTPAGSKVGAKP